MQYAKAIRRKQAVTHLIGIISAKKTSGHQRRWSVTNSGGHGPFQRPFSNPQLVVADSPTNTGGKHYGLQ
jgi:hypothetical protein